MILIDCRLVVVCIRRYTVLHFEEIIGIAINVRFGVAVSPTMIASKYSKIARYF